LRSQRIVALAKKDLKKIARDPGTLFLLVLFPLVLTLVFGLSFGGIGGNGQTAFDVGVIALSEKGIGSGWSRAFVNNLSATGVIVVKAYADNESAQQDLSVGEIQGVIVLPADFEESCDSFHRTSDPTLWTNTTILLYLDKGSMLATQTIPPLLDHVLSASIYGIWTANRGPVRIGRPFLVRSREFSTFDYFVPGLFAYAAIFLIMTVGQSFTIEREKGLLRRIRTTPTTAFEFLAGHTISNVAASVIQVGVIFSMAFLMGFHFPADPGGILMAVMIVMIFSLCCVGFGLITATLAKSPGSATGIAFVFIMPQMFLGTFMGFALSPAMEAAARIVPSFYVTDALTSLFLRGAPMLSRPILLDLAVVCGSSILVLLAGVILFGRYGGK